MTRSVFKNEVLTREAYTRMWIDLITSLERERNINPRDSKQ